MTLTTEYEHITTNGVPISSPAPSGGSAAGAVVASGPRLPRREAWLDLPEEYPDFRIRVWVNYPQRLNDDLRSGDEARVYPALQAIILEHNGWCDDQGNPLPSPRDADFWTVIPNELAGVLIVLVAGASGKLVASLIERSKR